MNGLRRHFQSVVLLAIGVGSGFYGSESSQGAELPVVNRIFPPGAMRGSTLQVEAQGKFPNPGVQVWSTPAGLTWSPMEEAGKFSVSVDPQAVAGVYFVRFLDQVGASNVHRFIIGTVPETSEVEPNNDFREATVPLSLPTVVNGVLQQSGDVDSFRLSAKAGETIVASLDASRHLRSPVDAVMQIVDLKGNVLATNHDYHDLDPLISWSSPFDQEVVVRVFGFPSEPNSTIGLAGGENYLYRLTVTTGPFLESVLPRAVSVVTTTSLAPLGWNFPASHPPVAIPAQAFDPVWTDDNFFRFSIDAVPGAITLPILSSPIHREADVAVSLDAAGEPLALASPLCISGSIAASREVDRYWFIAEKDVAMEISVASRELGYPLDPLLEIFDAAGNRLHRIDDLGASADPKHRFVAPVSGRYQVCISDVNAWGDPHAYYLLRIDAEAKDFRLSATTDLFTGKIGEKIEIPVRVERLANFDLPIRISLAALPEGCSCSEVLSEPSGDSSKEVRLELLVDRPLNVPLRIIGRSEGFERGLTAQSGLKDLWLVTE